MKRRVVIIYECSAPEDVFKIPPEITQDRYDELTVLNYHGLPCDRKGIPGEWCGDGGCYWAVKPKIEED